MAQGPDIDRTEMTPRGLLELAQRKAEESRRECQALTASLFGGTESGLTDRQRATLLHLLRALVARVNSEIHGRIAEADEGEEWLGQAAPDAAGPVYEVMAESGAFEDGALAEAVLHRLFQHQLERAVRAPSRDAWLRDAGDAESDLASGLGIAEGSALWRLMEEYEVQSGERLDAYGEPTLPIRDLERALQARLYWDCAAALRETLPAGEPVDIAVERTARAAISELNQGEQSAAQALARGLLEEGLLTPEALVAMLRAGEAGLFEAALSVMAGLETGTLRRLLYGPGGEGFAILWRALGFPDALFDEIHTLSRQARGRPLADPAAVLERLRAFRERMPAEAARTVLSFWRLSPAYRAARQRVETRRSAGSAKGWG